MRSKKAVINIISNLFLQVFVIIYGFIIPQMLINKFGSEVNGLISSITQFLAYITLFESGFGHIVKAALYKPIAKKDKKTIGEILKTTDKFFKKISFVFIIYIIFLVILYPLIVTKNFTFLYTSSMIIIISLSIFAEYFFGMTYKLYIQAEQENYIIYLVQFVTYLVNLLITFVMIKIGLNIHFIKLISGIVFILRPIILNRYVRKKYAIDVKNVHNEYKIKNKWDGLSIHIAFTIHSNTDVTVLTLFANLVEVSVYSIYALVVRGIRQIMQSFSSGIDALFGNMIANNEKNNLKEKFDIYETFYFAIVSVVYSCTAVLIIPFVKVYTSKIVDANYVRELFAMLLVVGECVWAIRMPYSSLTYSSGMFKQIKKVAWVEAIVNIILSVILVIKYGIIGVALGTLCAMLIRTSHFVYFVNKNILFRNQFKSIKKIIILVVEFLLTWILSNNFTIDSINYLSWLLLSIKVLCISLTITLIFNFIFFKNTYAYIGMFLKRKKYGDKNE